MTCSISRNQTGSEPRISIQGPERGRLTTPDAPKPCTVWTRGTSVRADSVLLAGRLAHHGHSRELDHVAKLVTDLYVPLPGARLSAHLPAELGIVTGDL